ncbi:PREDICTED: vitellin-degrading protease-like, partial [Priapulus caudatus]|uniref:Vitellin-degrading protease-like n=1 Tax=Priapulus caudatus TaxID=37621 RepID=A0ABM1EW13_PRICU
VMDPSSEVSIKYGVTDITKYGKTAEVSEIHVHDQYSAGIYPRNDIATIILSSPILYSETASPIDLAETDSGNYAGEDAMVSGWGCVLEGGSVSKILQAVQVPVITNEVCTDRYGSSAITDDMLCAGYLPVGDKGPCKGDSGGPMVSKKGEQIGVVSCGRECARPGVYTRVSTLNEWISQHSISVKMNSCRILTYIQAAIVVLLTCNNYYV